MTQGKRNFQSGQSLVEFAIVFPTLLLLMMGVVQFSLIFVAKSTLNQATFLGVREGTLNNAGRIAIHLGLAKGLAPLYQDAVFLTGGQNVAALELARAQALLDVANPFKLNLQILNPSPLSFADFGEMINDDFGIPNLAIPNARLLYDTRSIGIASQQTIQDANLLKIRVTYCYDLIVPIVRETIRALFTGILESGGIFNSECYSDGGIPIEADATMLMQTPAYAI